MGKRRKEFLASKARTTADHDEIRRWAEVRGAHPVLLLPDDELRFVFEAPTLTADVQPLSWDAWFDRFDARDRALLIEETTSSGDPSRFHKLVNR